MRERRSFVLKSTVLILGLFLWSSASANIGLYKKIDLSRNPVTECRLTVGDLTGDGNIDFLFNDGRRVLKAFDWDGNLLWEKFNPDDPGVEERYHNFSLAIYDIDHDCQNEVIAFLEIAGKHCLVTLDGKTGAVEQSAELPFDAPRDHEKWGNSNFYMQDHIAVANLRGTPIPGDILAIHASKQKVAAYTLTENGLEMMWYWITDTDGYASGHYTFPYDIDNDGQDEVISGVDVLESDGTRFWRMDLGPYNPSHPEYGSDHADGISCADVDLDNPGKEIAVAAATGMWLYTCQGDILWHYPSKTVDPDNGIMDGEGVQEVLIGNFRPDIPGKEIIFYSELMSGDQSVVMMDKDGNALAWGNQSVGPKRLITYAIDWDGNRDTDEIYSRKGIFDSNFTILSYTMNWSYCNTGDGTDMFPPVVCDVQGDHREEIVWYDGDEILIIYNKDPLSGPVLPSPWNYMEYRKKVANDNHASSIFFDWKKYGNNPDTDPPKAPENLTGSSDAENSLVLSWTAPGSGPEDLPAFYKVLRDGIPLGITGECTFRDSGLTGGSSYTYEVYGIDEYGNISSSAASFDFQTLLPHNDPDDGPMPTVSAVIETGAVKPDQTRILPVVLHTSEPVVKVPETLTITFTDGSSAVISLTGSVPGTEFHGQLVLDSSVCPGKAHFSLCQEALCTSDNITGHTISEGGSITIDNTPPPSPPFIKVVDE